MSQNLVSLNLTDAQLTAVDAALTELETQLTGLIALPDKKPYKKMGQKSEAFCRQTLRVLEQNPQIVPPNMNSGVVEAAADLKTMELLRPRMVRLARLSERASDTDFALGSDVMAVALQGYSLLRTTGRTEGLDSLRKELGARFTRGPRQTTSAEPPAKPQLVPLAKAA
jgi:hypothetical protein